MAWAQGVITLLNHRGETNVRVRVGLISHNRHHKITAELGSP